MSTVQTTFIRRAFRHTHYVIVACGDIWKDSFLATPPDGADLQPWAEGEVERRYGKAPAAWGTRTVEIKAVRS